MKIAVPIIIATLGFTSLCWAQSPSPATSGNTPGTAAADDAVRRELEKQIDGEVRFDTISRALYSTDASVYQISPMGVVVPKNRRDVLRALEVCRRHQCPLTMRGGGTSQAGQAIGEGIQIDVSKYLNSVLEVNAAEFAARIRTRALPPRLIRSFREPNSRDPPEPP